MKIILIFILMIFQKVNIYIKKDMNIRVITTQKENYLKLISLL